MCSIGCISFTEFTQCDNYQELISSRDEVYVSTLYGVEQLSSIFVGFNFGSFIIYNFCNFSITYSSPFSPQRSPVIHFVYIEPENDPKYFVYLWVARGNQMYKLR